MTSKVGNRLYATIAAALRQRILEGEFAVGDRMPAERLLAAEYAVSRPTIREALFALEIDGLVEVRIGSGVYVLARAVEGGDAVAEMGPFEILEARRIIESEVCALAAARITAEELGALDLLLAEISVEATGDLVRSEDVDRQFHLTIAQATQNSALVNAVEALWEARENSREYRLMAGKAHAAGIVPRLDEHAAILDALRARDPEAARRAMRQHLNRVFDSILLATEVHEVELAKERIAAQRRKFASQS